MGGSINREDLDEIQKSIAKSKFCNVLANIPYAIFDYISSMLLYGPGNGSISVFSKKEGSKLASINSVSGKIEVPLMKMICFDIDVGFVNGPIEFREGLMDLQNFKNINKKIQTLDLKTTESYWILNYRRPKDVFGEETVYFYIINEFDSLIYIKEIKDNNLIDYEEMMSNYEKNITLLDTGEMEIPELETNSTVSDCVIVDQQPFCVPGGECCGGKKIKDL